MCIRVRNTIIKKCSLIAAVILCTVSINLEGQTVLMNEGDPNELPSVCEPVELGTTMSISLSGTCGASIVVEFFAPGTDISLGLSDQSTIFATDFDLTFDELGTYIFLCDFNDSGPLFPVPGFADVCFEAVEPAPPAAIPTIGEWGLVVLGLLILIVGVVYYRSASRSDIKA